MEQEERQRIQNNVVRELSQRWLIDKRWDCGENDLAHRDALRQTRNRTLAFVCLGKTLRCSELDDFKAANRPGSQLHCQIAHKANDLHFSPSTRM
jgi:hypothetical protein